MRQAVEIVAWFLLIATILTMALAWFMNFLDNR